MPNRMGLGKGFGFRGCSTAWPYVGRGRGGLPRCLSYGLPYNARTVGLPTGTLEAEIGFFRNQAQSLKSQLDLIEARIKKIERAEEGKEK
jgi:hypothetical protein